MIDLNTLETLIAGRGTVKISDRNGWGAGRTVIALGYSLQYDWVRVGFMDESGEYTGERTSVPRSMIETVPATVSEEVDSAHAEALEMDAAGEALTQAHTDALTLLEPTPQPKRWHYRAHRLTRSGAFLGAVEGYFTAVNQDAVIVEVRALVEAGQTYRLGGLRIARA